MGVKYTKPPFIRDAVDKIWLYKGALCILNVLFAAIIAEKHFRQFQHIVGIAGFRTLLAGNHRRKIGNRVKMFANTVSTNGWTSVIHYIVPRKSVQPVRRRCHCSVLQCVQNPMTFGICVLACKPFNLSCCCANGWRINWCESDKQVAYIFYRL